jgi:TDG/mug DNA glycosylase family protein
MDDVLPDVLAPHLSVLFCGNAAGTVSARLGAPYAGPGNLFWRTLHEVGLSPELLLPSEFHRLPEFGLGLTDACKVSFGSDAEVGTAAGVQTWVLPSTSGRARRYWSIEPWRQLARAATTLPAEGRRQSANAPRTEGLRVPWFERDA